MEFILVVAVVVVAVLIYKHARQGQLKKEPEEARSIETKPKSLVEEKSSDSESEREKQQTTAQSKPSPARVVAKEEQPKVQLSLPVAIAEPTQALAAEQDPLQRHRLLSQITELTYKNRKDASHRSACYYYSEIHLNEFESIKEPLKEATGGRLPQVLTFQNYSNLLVEDKRYDEAIEVCKKAMAFGLDDKTQTGFEGRIERIKARKAKDAS